MIERVLVQVAFPENKHCSQCWRQAMYVAHLSFPSRNKNGKPITMTQIRAFCEAHGKRYAHKFRLDITGVRTYEQSAAV